jgi:hypothetical protein
MASEALAALIADQRLGLARLQLCDLGLGVIILIILFVVRGSSLDLLQGLVLVVLEPLKSSLD